MKYILKNSLVFLLCLTLATCQEKTDPSAAPIPTSESTASVMPDATPSGLQEPTEAKSGLARATGPIRSINIMPTRAASRNWPR